MKYRSNQKKDDFAKALYLSKETQKRLLNAIQKVFDTLHQDSRKKDVSVDEINELIAPYIKTPEEAFFCAQTIMISVFNAQNNILLN